MAKRKKKELTHCDSLEMEELFLAVYFNDLKKVIAIKEQYPETYARRNAMQLDYNRAIDLVNLTFFNQVIWKEEDWNAEGMKSFVKRNRLRTEAMLDFWRTESGNPNLQRTIAYNQYWFYFFCDDPENPSSDYLNKGLNEADAMLYHRVECFDFDGVKEWLDKGANPEALMEEGDIYSNVGYRLGHECSHLCTSRVLPMFNAFERRTYHQKFVITEMFGELLGWAAHEEMYNFIFQYQRDHTTTGDASK